jgi:hypothetical protein
VSLLGVVLWMEIAIRWGDREPAWIAMDLALALLAQAAAFLVFVVSSRIRSPVRHVLPIAAVPFLLAFVNYGYMVAIPARFLIEDVESPERADWSVVCTVAGAWIAPVRAGAGLHSQMMRDDCIPPQPFFSNERAQPPLKQESPLKPSGFTNFVHSRTASRISSTPAPCSVMR